jgi:hypothetical protein
MLVWALLKYLENFYGSAQPLSFAVAATKEGNNLLYRFKLNLQSEATGRADGYRLYSIVLSPEVLEKRLACLPDWQMLCLLDWGIKASSSKNRARRRRPPPPQAKPWRLSSQPT